MTATPPAAVRQQAESITTARLTDAEVAEMQRLGKLTCAEITEEQMGRLRELQDRRRFIAGEELDELIAAGRGRRWFLKMPRSTQHRVRFATKMFLEFVELDDPRLQPQEALYDACMFRRRLHELAVQKAA